MFTGIVTGVGRVARFEERPEGARIGIDCGDWPLDDVAVGDSIAVNGCCLTVVAVAAARIEFDVSGETLRCTAAPVAGARVNLEKALRASDRLGGHLVSGHVDGVGSVCRFEPVPAGFLLEVEAPRELAKFIARKGSVTIDGVSLTVNEVRGAVFSVNLIPHTLSATALDRLATGEAVNLEVDLIARYVERLVAASRD